MYDSPTQIPNNTIILSNLRKWPTVTTQLQKLNRGEEGGAYTLSYVMVIPLLMLLVCAIVETTLMMSAKLGTVYAAYAAANCHRLVVRQQRLEFHTRED